MVKNGDFESSVIHGIAIGLGLSIALGAVKIFSNTTGIGKDFVIISAVGETQNVLTYGGQGKYGLR